MLQTIRERKFRRLYNLINVSYRHYAEAIKISPDWHYIHQSGFSEVKRPYRTIEERLQEDAAFDFPDLTPYEISQALAGMNYGIRKLLAGQKTKPEPYIFYKPYSTKP